MKREEFILSSDVDSLGISVLSMSPDSCPHAVLQISHGMCGRKERYLPFMRFMASNGVACIINDHRGHGASVRSSEDLGYMYDGGAEALVSDMKQVSDHAHQLFPGLPSFLLGHSMGSLAALSYIGRYKGQLSGLILCGVPSRPALLPLSGLLMKGMCSIGLGRIRMKQSQKLVASAYNHRFKVEGTGAWICSDPLSRYEFTNDPVCSFIFTANASCTLMDLFQRAYSMPANSIRRLPVLLLSGQDDPCTDYGKSLLSVSRRLSGSAGTDITIRTYPHMRHEILNEAGRLQVWRDILDFCLLRLGGLRQD